MKYLLLILCISLSTLLFAQNDKKTLVKELEQYQEELNKQYKDSKKSPLEEVDLKQFEKHDFYAINLDYRVKATLTMTENEGYFDMLTTTTRKAKFRKYGVITFEIKGKKYALNVYQAEVRQESYQNSLFLPFKDLTNGVKTYAGGRYMELSIPKEGSEIIVDFNKAYNPYCAYSSKYSCPVVPSENHLNVHIKVGIRYKNKKE